MTEEVTKQLMLFRRGLPDPVPVLGRGCSAKGGDAGKEFQGGTIVLFDLQAGVKALFSILPLLLAVVLESSVEGVTKFGGTGIQFSCFTEKLVNTNRFCFPVDSDEIEFTDFDLGLDKAIALLVDDEIGTIDFIHPFQAGSDVDGVADDGERFGGVGSYSADEGVPSC